MITEQQKKDIQWHLQNFVFQYPSQRQAAQALEDCSEATLIAILTNKWNSVSDNMWRSVSKQIGVGQRKCNLVETMDFSTLILYYSLAKEEGATFAIVGGAGFGKSATGKWYAANNRNNNAYYLECAEYWNKKTFLTNVIQSMGKNASGMNVGEMMEAIVKEIRKQNKPVFILDEIDKLSDTVLKFFITFYNELNTLCGFVWTSTNAMEKRMRKGLNSNKSGYQEVFSRIGSRFIELRGTSADEVRAICQANGITSEEDINRIINEYGGDLRRVDRNFLKYRAKDMQKKLKSAA